MPAQPLLVDNVSKRYRSVQAVDGVSFRAEPGRILGLLGPNGAGKTSTIRMVTYITVPDTGRILFGDTPVGPEAQQRMGYLPEERGLYKRTRVGPQLVYLGRLKGLSKRDAEREARRWLGRFDAADWYDRRVEALSKGQQQKVQFCATIQHAPDLLIFDEPFSGLDPINAALLKTVILELRDEGRTILFASHRMEQVEQLCDDVVFLNQGRAALQGPLRDIRRRYGTDTVTLGFDGPDAFLHELVAEGAAQIVRRGVDRTTLRLGPDVPAGAVLERAVLSGAEVSYFDRQAPPLDDVFHRVIRAARETREAENTHVTTGNGAGHPAAASAADASPDSVSPDNVSPSAPVTLRP